MRKKSKILQVTRTGCKFDNKTDSAYKYESIESYRDFKILFLSSGALQSTELEITFHLQSTSEMYPL